MFSIVDLKAALSAQLIETFLLSQLAGVSIPGATLEKVQTLQSTLVVITTGHGFTAFFDREQIPDDQNELFGSMDIYQHLSVRDSDPLDEHLNKTGIQQASAALLFGVLVSDAISEHQG